MSTLQNQIYMCIFSSTLQWPLLFNNTLSHICNIFWHWWPKSSCLFLSVPNLFTFNSINGCFFFCSPGRMSKSYQGHWQETIWGIIRVWHQCIQAKVSLLCQEWGRFGPVYNCWVTGTAKSIVLKTYYVWLFHNSMNERLLFRVIESDIRRSVGHLSRKAICFFKIDLNLMNKPNPCNTG